MAFGHLKSAKVYIMYHAFNTHSEEGEKGGKVTYKYYVNGELESSWDMRLSHYEWKD
jgi:hypothetical protein